MYHAYSAVRWCRAVAFLTVGLSIYVPRFFFCSTTHGCRLGRRDVSVSARGVSRFVFSTAPHHTTPHCTVPFQNVSYLTTSYRVIAAKLCRTKYHNGCTIPRVTFPAAFVLAGVSVYGRLVPARRAVLAAVSCMEDNINLPARPPLTSHPVTARP